MLLTIQYIYTSLYTLFGCISHDDLSVHGHESLEKNLLSEPYKSEKINTSRLFIHSRAQGVKGILICLDKTGLKGPVCLTVAWSVLGRA
jgi:hypothetical protein